VDDDRERAGRDGDELELKALLLPMGPLPKETSSTVDAVLDDDDDVERDPRGPLPKLITLVLEELTIFFPI
jgi:hypothetical protein